MASDDRLTIRGLSDAERRELMRLKGDGNLADLMRRHVLGGHQTEQQIRERLAAAFDDILVATPRSEREACQPLLYKLNGLYCKIHESSADPKAIELAITKIQEAILLVAPYCRHSLYKIEGNDNEAANVMRATAAKSGGSNTPEATE